MHSIWVKSVKPADKANRIKEVQGYATAFTELKQILEKEFKKKPCVRDYEVPNWDIRQVAVNEYNQALDDLIKIITLSKE
jgi:hypothetical protein